MNVIVLFGIIMFFCCVLPMVFMSLNRDKNMNHSGGCCSHKDKDTDHVENKEK